MKRFSAALLLLLALAAPADAAARREARVNWVIDGDTFQTSEGERVRLIGVDAPEYQPHRKKIDPGGLAASEYARKLLDKKKVILEGDVEPLDKYGRTLAYVYLEDGTFVNRLLIAEGLAKSRYYKPNGLHYAEFKAAQAEAKRGGKGLWADATSKKVRSP